MFNTYSQATTGKRGITVLDRYLLALLLCVIAAWWGEPLRYRRAWDHPGFTTLSVFAIIGGGLLALTATLIVRWLQGRRPWFGLRTLMLIAACVCVACGRYAVDRAQAARTRSRIAAAEARGLGIIDRWPNRSDQHFPVFFEPVGKQAYTLGDFSPEELCRLLKPFDRLEVVAVWKASDEHVQQLTRQYPKLRAVDFEDDRLTDDALKALERCRELRFAIVSSAKITDAGIDSLTKLPHLAGLNLSTTSITDKALTKLTAVSGLRHLDIRGCKITSDAVAAFRAKKPECKVFYNGYSRTSFADLSADEWQSAMEQIEQ